MDKKKVETASFQEIFLYRVLSSPGRGKQFVSALSNKSPTYYAYARHALRAGLAAIGVGPGDKVLIPSFICRDVLGSISALGAQAVFYDVDKSLSLASNLDQLPSAKAVLAVNYFGFPQNLTPFRAYTERTGAVLIEDNAHGLFSRDDKGRFLGTRGDLGLFSIRKSIPIGNGAALTVNNADILLTRPVQHGTQRARIVEKLRFLGKSLYAKAYPLIGGAPLALALFLKSKLKPSKAGVLEQNSNEYWEENLPRTVSPSCCLPELLDAFPWEEEHERRRLLYSLVAARLAEFAVTPVFEVVPDLTTPYMFCFYSTDEKIPKVADEVKKMGLRLVQWPDLPRQVREGCPDFYKMIWAIPLMW